MENSGSISTPLSGNLITQYEYYFNQDGLARPGILLIQGCVEDGEITIEDREFVF